MMQGPVGKVEKLEYRDMRPKMQIDASALLVHFTAPDGEIYTQQLANGTYEHDNQALQLMALNEFQPTDISRSTNTSDWGWYIQLAPDHDGGYAMAESELQGGVQALKDAEWFAPQPLNEQRERPTGGPHGGGGPDPGTGNRGGVDHEEEPDVVAEITPDANTGINMRVQ